MMTDDDSSYFSDIETRIRRARSWLDSARRAGASGNLDSGHWDIAFILYWIAFNAAFARDDLEYPNTRCEFSECFRKVLRLDSRGEIFHAVRDKFPSAAEEIVSNKYLFKKYWDHVNGKRSNDDWKECLKSDRQRFTSAMTKPSEENTEGAIPILFERLYTLRNQIVHGGATWKSKYNRTSVRWGVPIMAFLVPVFVRIIKQHPEVNWGTPYYRPGLQGKTNPE